MLRRCWEREDRVGRSALAALALALAAVLGTLAVLVWNTPAPGDISRALSQNPELYTLSLGHMADLTLAAFAYLKAPLVLAAVAFLVGGIGVWRLRGARMVLAQALMMVLFFQATRRALVAFDPYLGSRALADALTDAPAGELMVDNQYYAFSSVFSFSHRRALLLNGCVNNLEYGSYAPGPPQVLLNDEKFRSLWMRPERRDPLPEFRFRSWHMRGLRSATPRFNFGGPVLSRRFHFLESVQYEIRATPIITLPFPYNEQRREGFNSFTAMDYDPEAAQDPNIVSPTNVLTATLHAAHQHTRFANLDTFDPEP